MSDHDTREFEHVLDLPNVIGVWWDEQDHVLRTIVSEKLPPEELAAEALVENAVDDDIETDVLNAGMGRGKDGFDPHVTAVYGLARQRQRPVQAGVSEIHERSTAATAGHYPALVVDPSKGLWADDIGPGHVVRLSNNHVYARRNQASLGDRIRQPSPYDEGKESDTSGRLAGYVPLSDGVRVDVAARTANETVADSPQPFGLPDEWPTGVRRDDYESLVGEPVRKSGRTTAITDATVLGINASIRVRFGDPLGVLTLPGQLVTADLSLGGDSGSPVYTHEGELIGHLFAGGDKFTIVNTAADIESYFGVRLLTEELPEPPRDSAGRRRWTHPTFFERIRELLRAVCGGRLSSNVYLPASGRRADFVVEPADASQQTPWVGESATNTAMLLKKVGYVLAYAAQLDDARPFVVVPSDVEFGKIERDVVGRYVRVLTEREALQLFA